MSASNHPGILDILYVRFRIEDLEKQSKFLQEFGFAVEQANGFLLARGTDESRYVYVAEQGSSALFEIGFEAESLAALEAIARAGEVTVTENELPGGGVGATLLDPDGNQIRVVHGVEKPPRLDLPQRQPQNTGQHRERFGERVAFTGYQAFIKRLGHCVLFVSDFRTSEAWYKAHLGMLTSDEISGESEDKPTGAFLRCNRGEIYVDHHTLFLVNAGKSEFNHAAFEVSDWDALMLGHDILKKQDYEHTMGIGRHILGSQVFDYWKDPAGFTLEHFTDGDLFNESNEPGVATPAELFGSHWGWGA